MSPPPPQTAEPEALHGFWDMATEVPPVVAAEALVSAAAAKKAEAEAAFDELGVVASSRELPLVSTKAPRSSSCECATGCFSFMAPLARGRGRSAGSAGPAGAEPSKQPQRGRSRPPATQKHMLPPHVFAACTSVASEAHGAMLRQQDDGREATELEEEIDLSMPLRPKKGAEAAGEESPVDTAVPDEASPVDTIAEEVSQASSSPSPSRRSRGSGSEASSSPPAPASPSSAEQAAADAVGASTKQAGESPPPLPAAVAPIVETHACMVQKANGGREAKDGEDAQAWWHRTLREQALSQGIQLAQGHGPWLQEDATECEVTEVQLVTILTAETASVYSYSNGSPSALRGVSRDSAPGVWRSVGSAVSVLKVSGEGASKALPCRSLTTSTDASGTSLSGLEGAPNSPTERTSRPAAAVVRGAPLASAAGLAPLELGRLGQHQKQPRRPVATAANPFAEGGLALADRGHEARPNYHSGTSGRGGCVCPGLSAALCPASAELQDPDPTVFEEVQVRPGALYPFCWRC
mmetsp:Transcript_81101/g.233028  ORF Transcript_81101/g.233028 Transcript_81101/m.233028 type:complete len:524 (+) Transcript_81101:103-1674(+)